MAPSSLFLQQKPHIEHITKMVKNTKITKNTSPIAVVNLISRFVDYLLKVFGFWGE
jgi:hypothetical protein